MRKRTERRLRIFLRKRNILNSETARKFAKGEIIRQFQKKYEKQISPQNIHIIFKDPYTYIYFRANGEGHYWGFAKRRADEIPNEETAIQVATRNAFNDNSFGERTKSI